MGGVVCPACGVEALPGDRFCEECGADLPYSEEPAAAADARPSAPLDNLHEDAPDVESGAPVHEGCGGHFRDGWCDRCGAKAPDPRDHVVDARDASLGAVSDLGLRHHRNEDAFALERRPDGTVLAVVCDGVSTTVDPHIASADAVAAALATLAATDGDLVAAHRAADDAARAVPAEPHPDLDAPSATFSAFVLRPDGTAEVATLGDCRGYVLHGDGGGEQLTIDDSWAQAQIDAGVLTAEEAHAHPNASVITRWLGRDSDPAWEPRVTRVHLTEGDRLVLCSDGVWNYAPTADEAAKLADPTTPAVEQAAALVAHAIAGGGHDNATAVVAVHRDHDQTAVEPSQETDA